MHFMRGHCGSIAFEYVEVVGLDYEHVVDLELLVVDVLVEAEGDLVES